MKTIRVLLADEHTLVRTGIRLVLEQMDGIVVVGEVNTGREVLPLLKTIPADVVLMDIHTPDFNGFAATASICQDFPRVRVVVLSIHANELYVRQALHAGAAGYLLKDVTRTELELAIKAVARGEIYLSSAVAQYVVADYRRGLRGKTGKGASDPILDVVLTTRECELLQLIAEGCTTKEIAARLYLSPKAVEARRARLMERLDIHTLAGLIRYAIRLGLVSVD